MKKQILKSLVILLIIAMMSALLPINMVKAANPTNPKFEVTSAEGKAGEKVTVEVKLTEDTVFEDLTLAVDYDSTKLAVESEENDVILGENVSNLFGGKSIAQAGRVEFQAIDAQGEDTFTVKAGTVLTIRFKILEGVAGSTELSLKYDTTYTQLGKATIKSIVPVTGISLDKTMLELTKGEETTLVATVKPENATEDKTVTWNTTNANVATVSENGVVKAIGAGTTTIVAKVGEVEATCTVTVKSPMTGIELSETEVELVKGQTKKIEVKYIPGDTTDDRTVIWETSDKNVVEVENGVLKGIKAGEATITAKVGTFTQTVKVNVKEYPLEGIVAWTEKEEIDINEKLPMEIATNPANTTDSLNLEFTSSDEKIATVDDKGVITGVSQGEATITVVANEKYTQTIKIAVTDKVLEDEDNNNQEEIKDEEEKETTEAIEEKETTSVLPKTADIAIGAVVFIMIVAGAGAIYIIRKNKKLNN